MSRNEILRLSSEDPARLLELAVDPSTPAADLTFIAEELGDYVHARECLLQLTRHESPLVREGAVYGLARIACPDDVARLREIAETDASAGVREAAREAAEDLS